MKKAEEPVKKVEDKTTATKKDEVQKSTADDKKKKKSSKVEKEWVKKSSNTIPIPYTRAILDLKS